MFNVLSAETGRICGSAPDINLLCANCKAIAQNSRSHVVPGTFVAATLRVSETAKNDAPAPIDMAARIRQLRGLPSLATRVTVASDHSTDAPQAPSLVNRIRQARGLPELATRTAAPMTIAEEVMEAAARNRITEDCAPPAPSLWDRVKAARTTAK